MTEYFIELSIRLITSTLPSTTRLVDGATLLAGVVALLALAGAARVRYQRTLGRRRDRYARLGRLGTGAQLSFFSAVLGEPPAMRGTIVKKNYKEFITTDDPRWDPESGEPQWGIVTKEFTQCFFIDRDYYVQTISDDDETVLAFSVMTRTRRFTPTFAVPARLRMIEGSWLRWGRARARVQPLFQIRLGRSRFADLDPQDQEWFNGPHFKVSTGARSFTYSEFHYYGNPGYYQTYVFTLSSASPVARGGSEAIHVKDEVGTDEWPDQSSDDSQPEWDQMPVTQRFRRNATITTYTVIGFGLSKANYPSSFGPHGDEVRTLP